MFRQSAAWWCFVPAQLDERGFLRAVADCGYDGVELAPAEHWPLVHEHGLELTAVMGHGTLRDGLNRRENRARIVRELEDNLRIAERWRIPNLIVFSGDRGSISDAEGQEVCAGTLAAVAPRAEAAGVTLALELLNSVRDHPDYHCDHTAWGAAVCDMVASPAVKLLYDIYHMQLMEGNIIANIRCHHERIAHFHVAGAPGRAEPDASQELNYPAVLRAIADCGWRGAIGQEFTPLGEPAAALRAAHALVAAV